MFRFLAPVFLLILASQSAFADRPWLDVRSPNFILKTDISETSARKLILQLEKARATIGYLTGINMQHDKKPPLVIYGFERPSHFKFNYGLKRTGIGGFYNTFSDGPASASYLGEPTKSYITAGSQIVIHEYSHHIIHAYSGLKYPRWYDEGLGDLFSTIRYEGANAIIGDVPVNRTFNLRSTKNWVDAKKMIAVRGRYRYSTYLYAQGWLYCLYMFMTPYYAERMNDYFNEINKPFSDQVEAFERIFERPIKQFEKETKKWWTDRKLSYATVDISYVMPDFETTVRPLTEKEKATIDYESRIRLDDEEYFDSASRLKKGEAAFRAVIEEGTNPAENAHYLVKMMLDQEKYDDAARIADEMIEKLGETKALLTDKARALIAGRDVEDMTPEEIKTARKLAFSAMKMDKNFVPALLLYSEMKLSESEKITKTSLMAIKKVNRLWPDYAEGKEIYVKLLVRAKEFEKARLLTDKLIDWSYSKDREKELEELLSWVEEEENRALASAETATETR